MTTSAPTVSVIVPTYNSADTLGAALDSLADQRWTDWEAWIIGDGCTDDTAHLVEAREDPRIRWIALPQNSGGSVVPHREGVRRARGRLIAFLAHDDLWFPWHLEQLVTAADENASDVVIALGAIVRPGPVIDCTGHPGPTGDWTVHQSPPTTWVVRAELEERLGGWHNYDDVTCPPDADFMRRAASAGASVTGWPEITAVVFPAAAWQRYRTAADVAQPSYLAAMRQDPERLRTELLHQFAARHAAAHNALEPWRRATGAVMRTLWWRALDALGRQRGPGRWLAQWHYRRRRDLQRQAAGLPGT